MYKEVNRTDHSPLVETPCSNKQHVEEVDTLQNWLSTFYSLKVKILTIVASQLQRMFQLLLNLNVFISPTVYLIGAEIRDNEIRKA